MSIVKRIGRPEVFGIWVETRPFVRLRGEGIFQLLIRLLHAAAQDRQVRIVVACASWTEENLRQLMLEHGVPEQAVEIVVSRPRVPALMRWYHDRSQSRSIVTAPISRPISMTAWMRALGNGALDLTAHVAGSATWFGLLCGALFWLLPLSLAAACLLVVMLPYLVALRLRRKLVNNRHQLLAKFRLQRLVDFIMSLKNKVRSRWSSLRVAMLDQMVHREFDLLSKKIAARTDVQIWFVPSQTARGPSGLSVPLVTALPDAVYFDFPAVFAGYGMPAVHKRIQSLADRAAAVISYNEDVRRRHAIELFGVASDDARVIRHAPMNAALHLPEAWRRTADPTTRKALAGLIQKHFQRQHDRPLSGRVDARYLAEFPFDEVRYLFVSSQVRPHKNLFNLLTAFDALVRERYLPLKLFTTGNMTYAAPHVQSFLTERCLELDVINVPDLPSDIHAAFYGLAELTVVPTLFEGGFPFPFTESLSVDTPVVMSNIPAVREVLPDQLVPLALFDPYDPNSIADRIQWALEHRAELLREERTAYDELTQRTWDDVVKEYFDVFRSVADGRREQRSRPPIGRVSSIRTDVQARAG